MAGIVFGDTGVVRYLSAAQLAELRSEELAELRSDKSAYVVVEPGMSPANLNRIKIAWAALQDAEPGEDYRSSLAALVAVVGEAATAANLQVIEE